MSKVGESRRTVDSAIQGWLMDIPDKRSSEMPESDQHSDAQHSNTEPFLSDVNVRCHRPSSILSISSEDSVNLEQIISANFTTDMDEEIDLSELSLLDLVDDSSEDFWKLDNLPDHFLSTSNQQSSNGPPYENRNEFDEHFLGNEAPIYGNNSILEDKLAGTDRCSIVEAYDTKLNGLYYSVSSLPHSPPLTVANDVHPRNDRSGSFSSENSLTSQSTSTTTVRSNGSVQPTTSTSTSTIIASSSPTRLRAGSNCISRPPTAVSSSFIPQHSNITEQTQKNRAHRKPSKIPSIAEHSAVGSNPAAASNIPRFLHPSKSTVSRRATHIPSSFAYATDAIDTKPSSLIPLPSKSTTAKKASVSNRNTILTRFANTNQLSTSNSLAEISTKRRASHIPTVPTRSTTSLGSSPASSIFSSTTSSTRPQRSSQAYPAMEAYDTRPRTALGSRQPGITTSNIRSSSISRMPGASKSTGLGLRKPSSRNF